MVRVIGIGDNTVDLYVDHGLQYPGGNAVNVAVLAARLGAVSSYLGCVGNDVAGRLIVDSLTAEGVDLSHVRRLDAPNSWSRIKHRGDDRVFAGNDPGQRDRYDLGPPDFAFLAEHDLVHSSVYSGLEDELPRVKAASRLLSFDFSEEWSDAYFARTLPHIDIAFLSHPNATDQACRDLMERIAARGPRLVVVTRGRDGSMAHDRTVHFRQPIVPAEAVDTLGAGDAFIAAFLMRQLAGDGVEASLRAGAVCAAHACSYRGAFGYGIPIRPGQPGTEMLAEASPRRPSPSAT